MGCDEFFDAVIDFIWEVYRESAPILIRIFSLDIINRYSSAIIVPQTVSDKKPFAHSYVPSSREQRAVASLASRVSMERSLNGTASDKPTE